MTDTEDLPNLALIGATGGMGGGVLAELIERGIPVRTIVRRPDAVTATELVRPVVVDVTETDALTAALLGATTVISAFNPGWDVDDLYDRYLEGARSISVAAAAAGVDRLIVVGGASSLLDEDGHELIERGLPPEPYGSGVRAARDLLHEMRALQTPDWVFVSPPMNSGPVGPKGRTGTYRVGRDHPVVDDDGTSSISVEDLAVAIVDEATRPRFHRERFTVGY